MLKYYYSKGSSALAAHILLEELGTPYEAIAVPIPDGAHQKPDYLAINPKGRVPTLLDGATIVTETPAILTYLAETHEAAGLMPPTPSERARVHALNAYICATVHVAFAHKQRGVRWTDDPDAIEALKPKVAANLVEAAELVEAHMIAGPWVLGEVYSIADPYLFLMPRWMAANGLDLAPYPKLAAHEAAMLERPATRRAMETHGL